MVAPFRMNEPKPMKSWSSGQPASGRAEGWTFARFIPTPENRFALSAVHQVAACLASRRTRRAFNPLFLHGPSGTGKTHLVAALANEVTRQAPSLICALLTAADLVSPIRSESPESHEPNEVVEAASRSDLVVVEDLHQLPRRASETLVQLFDTLAVHDQQMVFTAATGPGSLRHLPARLTSRLASGLDADIEPLSAPGRFALLRDRSQRRQLAVSDDVLAWLAARLRGSGREIEGTLANLELLSRNRRQPLDLAFVTQQFQPQLETEQPTAERIAHRVSQHFHVDPRQLRSADRAHNVLVPRQISMYLARQLTGLSLGEIGAYFGGRDHTTVLHGCRKVEQALTRDPVLSGTIRQLRADLG